jgi:hypothetical protein
LPAGDSCPYDDPVRLMTPSRISFLALFFLIFLVSVLPAQHLPTAKLSEKEIEEVRENGVYPDLRIKAYTRFVEERTLRIKSLSGRPKSGQRVLQLDSSLQDLTALMDELGSNLDQYSDRHSDMRKSLKALTDATPKWISILHSLLGEPGFDVARKEAIESSEELADQANRLLKEQTEYFATHKEEKGQERNDPSLEAKPGPQ